MGSKMESESWKIVKGSGNKARCSLDQATCAVRKIGKCPAGRSEVKLITALAFIQFITGN